MAVDVRIAAIRGREVERSSPEGITPASLGRDGAVRMVAVAEAAAILQQPQGRPEGPLLATGDGPQTGRRGGRPPELPLALERPPQGGHHPGPVRCRRRAHADPAAVAALLARVEAPTRRRHALAG